MRDVLAWVMIAHQAGAGMLLTLVSIILRLHTMIWQKRPSHERVERSCAGETEINLGFFRRRVSWSERRTTRR